MMGIAPLKCDFLHVPEFKTDGRRTELFQWHELNSSRYETRLRNVKYLHLAPNYVSRSLRERAPPQERGVRRCARKCRFRTDRNPPAWSIRHRLSPPAKS